MKAYRITTYGCREFLAKTHRIPSAGLFLVDITPKKPTIADIQKAVSERYNIPLLEMKSARRAREVSRPRQVAMYISKQLTPQSLPEIGRRFGNRDHTTVIHAIRRIESLRKEDPELRRDVAALKRELSW
jgi:chromosomal replication initiator protein